MTGEEAWIILTLVMTTIVFFMTTMMGKNELKLRIAKKMGRFKGCIVANEIRKDGKLYKSRAKIRDNMVQLGGKEGRNYPYDIKNTVVNNMDLREGTFSEVTGSQINPFETGKGRFMSGEQISKLIIDASKIGTPQGSTLLSKQSLPIIAIGIIAIIIVAMLTGAGA